MKRVVAGAVVLLLLGASVPLRAQSSAAVETSTSSSSDAPSADVDPFLDLDLEAPAPPPFEKRGWLWAAASVVVVGSVVLAVLAARSGNRCFCVGSSATDCGSCN